MVWNVETCDVEKQSDLDGCEGVFGPPALSLTSSTLGKRNLSTHASRLRKMIAVQLQTLHQRSELGGL